MREAMILLYDEFTVGTRSASFLRGLKVGEGGEAKVREVSWQKGIVKRKGGGSEQANPPRQLPAVCPENGRKNNRKERERERKGEWDGA